MPRDFTEKRRAIARRVVDGATEMAHAMSLFRDAASKLAASGDAGFEAEDFEGQPDLAHVDAAELNRFLSEGVKALGDFAATPLTDASEDGTIADLLYSIARAN